MSNLWAMFGKVYWLSDYIENLLSLGKSNITVCGGWVFASDGCNNAARYYSSVARAKAFPSKSPLQYNAIGHDSALSIGQRIELIRRT